jgi:hypothetical protein
VRSWRHDSFCHLSMPKPDHCHLRSDLGFRLVCKLFNKNNILYEFSHLTIGGTLTAKGWAPGGPT